MYHSKQVILIKYTSITLSTLTPRSSLAGPAGYSQLELALARLGASPASYLAASQASSSQLALFQTSHHHTHSLFAFLLIEHSLFVPSAPSPECRAKKQRVTIFSKVFHILNYLTAYYKIKKLCHTTVCAWYDCWHNQPK